MKHIDNIIFDLGGVILNIRYQNSIEALSKLSGKDVQTLYTQHHQTSLFDDYETGKTTSAQFRQGLRELLETDLSDNQIDQAWNAMLLDLPAERIHLIEQIRKDKRVFLLSNTNEIHKTEFCKTFDTVMGAEYGGIDNVFEKAYYSHEMGDRKPHPSIFQTVIEEQKLDPAKTLFIDDTVQHIEGAQKTGLQTIHLNNGTTILDIFKEYYQ
ncbi:HAD family phosphatase [Limibacter armeniacum]|uniref:HAD family hydrolase n=1 Tax=Limibacter armeniacum TaxID=466084 RepID=UPI002FE6B297